MLFTPSVAVIVPVYNCEQYIEQAIRSVLLQPCRDICVIAVDDGSTDRSKAVLTDLQKEFADRMVVLAQSNQGVSVARNTGLTYAEQLGVKYIGFLDADDVWCKDFYDVTLQNLLDDAPELIQFDYYNADATLTYGTCNVAPDNPSKGYPTHFCAYLYRADIIYDNGLLFPKAIAHNEDGAFFFVYSVYVSKIKTIHRPIFAYRRNTRSVTHSSEKTAGCFFCHMIPAFEWAQKQVLGSPLDDDNKKRYSRECLSLQRQKTLFFVSESCKNGVRIRKIYNQLQQAGYDVMFHDNTIAMPTNAQQQYEKVLKTPKWFWIKMRFKGFVWKIARTLFSWKWVKKFVYQENISARI